MTSWLDAPNLYCPTMKETGRSYGWLRLFSGECVGWCVRAGSISIRRSLKNHAVPIYMPPSECALYVRNPFQRLMTAHALFRVPKDGPSWQTFVDYILKNDHDYWLPQVQLHKDVDHVHYYRLEGSTMVRSHSLGWLNATHTERERPEYREIDLARYYMDDLNAWEFSKSDRGDEHEVSRVY